MQSRRTMMIWMKDLIDHMAHCHDQLQWAGDDPTRAFLADSLGRDLHQCLKLCEQLRQAQSDRAGAPTLESGVGEGRFFGALAVS